MLSFDQVEYISHILPYYLPCVVYVVTHLVYLHLNGNLMWIMFFAYLINFPYYKWNNRVPQQE